MSVEGNFRSHHNSISFYRPNTKYQSYNDNFCKIYWKSNEGKILGSGINFNSFPKHLQYNINNVEKMICDDNFCHIMWKKSETIQYKYRATVNPSRSWYC